MPLAPRWALPASVVSLAAVLGLAACTASSPQPQPPSPTVTANGEPAPPAASSGASEAAPASTAKADAPPQSTITNEAPPGGTVTANGTPAPAGSDRLEAMKDLVKANKDGFRKCFDLWAKKNPGQPGKIAFQFFLKPDGTLEKAQMKADEGDVHAAEVENCMIAFAKTLTYPKSSVGKDTIYTHRFEFKAASK